MTKRTKYILLAISGLGLVGGALIVCVVLIIGVIYLSSQTSEAKSDDAPVTSKKLPKKSDDSKTNSKVGSKVFDDDNDSKTSKEDLKTSDDDQDSSISKNDLDEQTEDETENSTPTDLVGEWTRSDGSSQIDATGKTQYGGGAHYTYQFLSDGSVNYTMEKKVLTIMQCKIAEKKTAAGNVIVDDDNFIINFSETNIIGSNSCEETENVEKTLPPETIRLKWHLKTEYDITRLCLDEKDGEVCYDKKDK